MFMHARLKAVSIRCLVVTGFLGLCGLAFGQSGAPAATIRRVDVLSHGNDFELEIEASQPVVPKTQVVTGPDRLVIDFPNSIPGPQLHAIAVKTLHVKSVRMGLFASNPPVARVVVDLNSPQAYEVFPSGKTVIVKVNAGGKAGAASSSVAPSSVPAVVASNAPASAPEPPKPVPTFQVDFSNGKLKVVAERATLGDVLRAIGRKTGANVSLPPRAEQDPVIANLGPGPARDVISALLDGVPYNVILMGSGADLSQVTRIVLTPRAAATGSIPANYAPAPVEEAAPEPEPEPAPPPPPPVGQEVPPPQDTVPPPPQ